MLSSSIILVWSRGTLLKLEFSDDYKTCRIVSKRVYKETILTASSDLVLFRQNSVHDKSSKIACDSRKLLYSGRLISKELIASGTIQNDVEIWCAKNGTVRKRSKVLFV